jgi:hypothetical protein
MSRPLDRNALLLADGAPLAQPGAWGHTEHVLRGLFACAIAGLVVGCQTPPSPGSPCVHDADCASPLACRFGACRSACSADRDCGAGRACLLDVGGFGVCSVETDVGCESGGHACPTGLVCAADRCAQICSPTMGCATGSVCTSTGGTSFCVSMSAIDGGGADVGTPSSPCDRLVDLSDVDAGPLPIVYRTDTTSAPSDGVLPLVPCTSGATRVAHQVGLRYRMRQDARLRIDTHRPYTAADLDTVAGVFTSCGPEATSLGCDDDDDGDPHARVLTTTSLGAGTEVIIGVGGFDPPGTGSVSAGMLEIVIQEAVLVDPPGACDPTGETTHCSGSGCALLRTGQAMCVTETPEVEPNPVATPQPIDASSPVVVSAHFPAGDEDCYAITVPAGGSVVATITDGNGQCPNPFTPIDLVLHDAGGAVVAEVDGSPVSGAPHCPPLDGTSAGTAHALAGGAYTLCVEVPDGELAFYDLSIHTLP